MSKQATPPYPMPFTRVEVCVFSLVDGALCVLLGQRAGEPFKSKWALPGGVLRIDLDTDLAQAAKRVASERLTLALPYLRQQCAVGAAGRDPRAPWALSIVYRAFTSIEHFHPQSGKRFEKLQWWPADAAAEDRALAFDHAEIIRAATNSLRVEVERLEFPGELLPPHFTLGELQLFSEQVLGRTLDKSSFRRKLDARGLVEPVPDAVRRGPNRPAQLFRLAQSQSASVLSAPSDPSTRRSCSRTKSA